MRRSPFVDHQRHERDSGYDAERGDEARTEPIILLAFVENYLQTSDAEDDERQADVIDLDPRAFKLLKPRRIFDHSRGKKERKQSDGHVNEEDPAPVVVISDPTAEC